MATAARTVEACRGAPGRLPGRLPGLGAACPAAPGCLDGTPCGLSESLWPCRHTRPPTGVSRRGPPRPTVLTLPGDLPGVQSPKVPEGRMALWARPAGSCPLSARPRTHAFLQLCITRSCSPATALQAASSLVHCSWWVASARQGVGSAGCQPRRPWWLLGPYCPLRPSDSQVSGEAFMPPSLPSWLWGLPQASGPRSGWSPRSRRPCPRLAGKKGTSAPRPGAGATSPGRPVPSEAGESVAQQAGAVARSAATCSAWLPRQLELRVRKPVPRGAVGAARAQVLQLPDHVPDQARDSCC